MARTRSLRSAALSVAVLILSLVLAPWGLAQDDPNTARGFSADNLYQFGEFDSVDLFNGNLSMVLPLGPKYPVNGSLNYQLQLTYNSNVWDFGTRKENKLGPNGEPAPEFYTFAYPSRQFNAGLGWKLSLGELHGPSTPSNASSTYSFIGADGGSHRFYNRLHASDPIVSRRFYTRDNSYLRLEVASDGKSATVESPDGLRHHFSRGSTLVDFQLDSIEDRHGNQLSVAYSNGGRTWTLSDGHRTHYIYFSDRSSDGFNVRMVDRLDLAAFNGSRAVYTFTYNTTFSTARHCQDTDLQTNVNAVTPVLTRVNLPDGSSWRMPQYRTSCSTGPGMLGRVQLPTLGQIDYEYGTYSFIARSTGQPGGRISIQDNYGVVRKRLLNASGGCYAFGEVGCEWLYASAPDPNNNHHRTTTVTLPATSFGTRDRVVHHFTQNPELDWDTFTGWEYGLPIHPTVKSGPRHLSQEIFHGSAKVREIWMQYERDQLVNNPQEPNEWYDRNRRVKSRQTVYKDDGNRYRREVYLDFDGLGHYRRVSKESNFAGGETRVEDTEYNAGRGSYTVNTATNGYSGGYQPWPVTSPWIIGNYTETSQSEGGPTAKQQYCFNANTGDLLRERILKGSSPGSKDVVTVWTYDGVGNAYLEQKYGADTGSVGTGSLCTTSLGAERYRQRTDYSFGSPWQQRWLKSNAALVLRTYSAGIDANTGLPKSVTEPNDLVTTFSYDTSGRLLSEIPQAGHGARTTYTYTRAISASSPAEVLIRNHSNNGSTVLTQRVVEFDPFGRPWQDQLLEPSGNWSNVVTTTNAMGWKHTQTVRGTGWPSAHTRFRDYDAFGRIGKIIPPDGSGHQVFVYYTGDRRVRRDYKVCVNTNGCANSDAENTFSKTELYDKHGRLYQVQEPSGPHMNPVYTTYSYDVGNRLRQASTSALGITQTRLFTYDHRGFLTSERHPEKGGAGNGTVSYYTYDPLGNPGRKVDVPFDVRYVYDRAGRLTTVQEWSGGLRPVKRFTYGSTNSSGNREVGQVATADRYNYITLAGNQHTVQVQETYTYGGKDGAVSRRDSQLYLNGGAIEGFTQGFTWRDLGNPQFVDYPECTHPCGAATPRRVQFNVKANHQGYLGSVRDLTTGIDYATDHVYHANGMVSQTIHGNGVIDVQTVDSSGIARPARFYTAGTNSNWDSGTYRYDGSGNITQIGSSSYSYDAVSRLTRAQLGTAQIGTGSLLTQTYSYDPFGNIETLGAVDVQEDSATNRLKGSSYDGAGNLTNYNGTVFEYDALGMVKRRLAHNGDERVFIYTADDERLWSYHWTGSRWTLRDLDGQVLRDYRSGPGGWSVERDYVYANGKLLAAQSGTGPGTGTTYHYHPDHLGTPRLITNQSGQKLAYHAYYPYGEEATDWNQDSERMKYTGHERDFYANGAGDDLDYQHARYYSPFTGRYVSPDPLHRREAAVEPQKLNRYAYTLGNPLKHIDPNGQDAVVVVISPGKGDWTQLGGHAAIYVERDGVSAGLSWGTPVQFDQGVDHMMETYVKQGRVARRWDLATTTEQDEQMIQFIEGGNHVDTNVMFGGSLRENCAKAVCNTLEAGGLLENAEDILGVFDNPAYVASALNHGKLAEYVYYKEIRKPGKPTKKITVEGVKGRADPFAGTGFCSADNVCH